MRASSRLVAELDNVGYYDGLARCYELFFHDLEASQEREGAWLDAILRPAGVNTVLDACCGTGRQSIPLARLGYHVWAADPSGAMLDKAQVRALQSAVVLGFLQASFVELPAVVQDRADAVVALGNGLCHLTTIEEIQAALEALRACCKPDGLCLIGIKDFDAIAARPVLFHRHPGRTGEGERCLLFEIWNVKTPLLEVSTFLLEQGAGGTEDRVWEVTIYHTHEYMLGAERLNELARSAGFSSAQRLPHACEAVYALRPRAL